jgi:23S rRNA (guanine2445-N2)-methyltransferase / 23S rRNA (guanine2069-N7)-methyltransferase
MTAPLPEDLVNRLRKNLRRLGGWAKGANVTCYRLYDRDLPEYAFSADVYEGLVNLQEYTRPGGLDDEVAEARLQEGVAAVAEVLNIGPECVFVKRRERGRGGEKYGLLSQASVETEVQEGGLKFLVNLSDHHDVGLFLDHRPLRRMIRREAAGKSFLNLFCYTGSVTVFAAAGGASASLSVDLSNSYTEWARRNLELNGFSTETHKVFRGDCLRWLRQADRRFDVIYIDPPTISVSKAMTGSLDIQRDHALLLRQCRQALNPGGTIWFSCNLRSFVLDHSLTTEFVVQELGERSLDPDFERNPKIHRVFRLSRVRG